MSYPLPTSFISNKNLGAPTSPSAKGIYFTQRVRRPLRIFKNVGANCVRPKKSGVGKTSDMPEPFKCPTFSANEDVALQGRVAHS